MHEVIIGLLLGDLNVRKKSISHNAHLYFVQGLIHEGYILHLYELFKDFCYSATKYSDPKPDRRTGKIYSSVYFYTYSLPCFNKYHELFYVNGVKKIPLNIGDLLTPLALAYSIMDDGSLHKDNGLYLCTNAFTLEEVELLIKVLKDNFNLNATYHKYKAKDCFQYMIYISAKDLSKVQELVSKHIIPSMLYKIGL